MKLANGDELFVARFMKMVGGNYTHKPDLLSRLRPEFAPGTILLLNLSVSH